MSSPGARLALGVIVPCRNEAAVIERKLRNLAASDWPPTEAGRPHRLVIVDDGSDDDTGARARSLCAALFRATTAPGSAGAAHVIAPLVASLVASLGAPVVGPVAPVVAPVIAQVVANGAQPGKAGAIRQGLAALEGAVDVVVLTDADVVVRPPALRALAEAFAARSELGMACGRQEFVRELGADGSCRGADGGEPLPAPDDYDRLTARVRAWESRHGRLFSVHGQLLAWRAALGVQPTPGMAADDLDLMFQVRERGLRVELLPAAGFLEVKTRTPQTRASQELRRARAYVQVIAGRRSPAGAPLFDRCQLAFYRRAPLAAPLLVSGWSLPALALLAVALLWLANRATSVAATGAVLLALALLLALPVLALATSRGRQLVHLLEVIRQAQRIEAATPLTDRWEMARH